MNNHLRIKLALAGCFSIEEQEAIATLVEFHEGCDDEIPDAQVAATLGDLMQAASFHEQLAALFTKKLKAEIGEIAFAFTRHDNAIHPGGNTEQDYCDANMVMLGAYAELKDIDEDAVDLQAATEDMDAAWAIATAKYLTAEAKD